MEQVQFVLGEQVQAILSLQVRLPIDYPLAARLYNLQQAVQTEFYQHFGYELDAIHVHAKSGIQKKKIIKKLLLLSL
ncbi:hypothetical protein OL548_21765 [Lysinibacillus sp. MHQ-1]|nr:hypothetical protein OL548_21765 [Lysinibacillus sp. MHQ-1]